MVDSLLALLPFAAIILGGQGLLTVFSERRLKQAQARDVTANTVLSVLAGVREDRDECREILGEAVHYISDMRLDMVEAGIKVRPLPITLAVHGL